MALPQRVFFTLHETAARWGCTVSDIAGWATTGKLQIMTGIAPVQCGETPVAGQVVLSPMDLLPMFRRCGTGPQKGEVRRVLPPGGSDWLHITDPAEGVSVSIADMIIATEEVLRFEDEHDLLRRVVNGTGATSPYDWDGMTVALIKRIHDDGLPATQTELVAEMQDWFADRSNGAQMPDGRSIRRRITPIWRALRHEPAQHGAL